jgi:hypothetical protein
MRYRDSVPMNDPNCPAGAHRNVAPRPCGKLRSLSEAEQSACLEARAARARPGEMAGIIAKAGKAGAVRTGDELPEDWPPASDRGAAAPEA